jgi:hypothetical protein
MNYTAEACAAPGGVYTTAHGPELYNTHGQEKPVLLLGVSR